MIAVDLMGMLLLGRLGKGMMAIVVASIVTMVKRATKHENE
jgi:hypothetical protein